MRNTGIVRRVDELGRIVLPKELRRTMDIKEGDPLEIYVDEDRILLKKYDPTDNCENAHHIVSHDGKYICKKCGKTFAEEALK